MYGSAFDGIIYFMYGCIVVAILGVGSCSYNWITSPDDDDVIAALGNSIKNIESLKRDCEKDLPRNEECVLIYEFIPVKTKGEK
jgi:hypothetical protein